MKKYLNMFLLAICAGIAIAVGGTVYLTLENKIIGSLLFTVGLYAIVLNGLFLYTGKIGYLATEKDKKPYLLLLLATWLGNFVGTGLGALAVRASRIGGIKDAAAAVSEVKLSDNLLSILLLSIFCGLLMFIAVDGYKEKGNPMILFLCVSVFILCGFEHCIANMFYFSLAGVWSVKAFGYLLVMTLGNSIGGMLYPYIKMISQK